MTRPAEATSPTLWRPEVLSGPLDFEEFFAEHHVRLFRAVWLLARDRHEAEEIMQDSFVRLWERWPRVSEHPDPVAYLYRTAMNLFRSRRRRAGIALRRVARALPVSDPLEGVEERDAAVRALAPLTPGQRASVVLVDVLGMTAVEAAEALGVKPSTVRVLLGRGRTRLRKEMNHDG